MAGFAFISGQQRHDLNGLPYIGALAYFYLAGTTTPLVTYRSFNSADVPDAGNTHPHPVPADGYGVFPDIYLDEGDLFYKLRITDADGNLLRETDGIPIIGPSTDSGGGGTPGPSVDANALFDTGDFVHSYKTGARDGWVRANGRTIGSAVSGAAERANADTQALFEHLWTFDANLTVSGGRGLSALADWNANKTITLPTMRHRMFAGLGDMGNSNAGLIASGYVDAPYSPIVLGGKGGEDDIALTEAQLAAHSHEGETEDDGSHLHLLFASGSSAAALTSTNQATETTTNASGAASVTQSGAATAAGNGRSSLAPAHTHEFETDDAGGGQAHENMPPFMLVTVYLKL